MSQAPQTRLAQGPSAAFTKAPRLSNIRGTLRRLARYLAPRWKTLILVLVLSLVSTAATLVGTRLNGYAVDAFILVGDMRGLALLCAVLAVIYVAGVICQYAQGALMVRVAQRTAARIREELFGHTQGLPLRYFDTHPSGDLMSRMTNDVDNINTALSQNAVQMFSSVVMVVGTLGAMLWLSPLLTLVCVATTPVTLLISRVFLRLAQKHFVTQQRELGEINGYIEEMVSGQKIVRLFSRETVVQEAFEGINHRLAATAWKAQAVSGVIGPCNNFINNLAYLLVAVAGGVFVVRESGAITVGMVFAFLLYMRSFTNPINNILSLVNTLQLALASAERVFAVMDQPEERDEPDAVPAGDTAGDIRMDIRSFGYEPDTVVLHDTRIHARPGQTIAIVGPTGAGKTTVINLLTRFYDLTDGSISLDGRDIRQLTRFSLRRSVAVVLQDTYLFTDTVRENIRLGRPEATDADVEEAARLAYAHDFITLLPHAYDTHLTDNGGNLSHGQRQLIGIARAMLSDAPVLVLDEATSSIDTHTELLIQGALRELMRGKTSFVIAHRLSTVRNADSILVIDRGTVIEQGSHEELLRKDGFYAALYASQFQGKVEEA